jgi:hypothetical protein
MTADQDKRKHPRMPGHHRAAVIHAGYPPPIMCTVADISEAGAGLTLVDIAGIPDTFTLEIKGESKVRACKVVWKKEPHRLGVAFEPDVPA